MPTAKPQFWQQWGWFLLGAVFLVAYRLFHLELLIDGPHVWRQCDTANYIYAFYRDGIDLFHPSVCWMGDHKTLALEFPLPEAIIAGLYKIFGESHVVARLFFLGSFLMSALYLFRIVRMISGLRIAQIGTLIYMAMPMGLFYSRAIHVDFFAIWMAHAMVWHFLRATDSGKWSHMILGTAFASIAFLVKVPYAFYLVLPVGWYALTQRNLRFWLPRAGLLIIPIGLFWWWSHHRHVVNSAAPDWDFIPHYRKFTDMWGWYFGGFWERSTLENYTLIGSRILNEIISIAGPGIAFLAFFLPGKRDSRIFWGLWLFGTGLYMVIFLNLNRIHNYYQIPAMAPLAILAALGWNELWERWIKENKLIKNGLAGILVMGFMGWGIYSAETNYYTVNTVHPEAGWYLRQELPETDLIIASHGGLDPRAPHLLYRARHNGWSIPFSDLSQELVKRLQEEGAQWLAVIAFNNGPEILSYLGKPEKEWDLAGTEENLYLFRLR